MSWQQITLETVKDQAADIEAAVMESGAYSVTYQDAKDQPILEPGVGETPLWNKVQIVGLYPAEADIEQAISVIKHQLGDDNIPVMTVEDLPEQDWTRTWMEDFKPMCFGDKFWVYPSTEEAPADQVSMILDPGLAFGTGTHPTTAMCLSYLAEHDLSGQTIIDYGCGSGILAIAALKLGAVKAYCVDNDPQALQATLDNAERNQIPTEQIVVLSPSEVPNIRVDLLIANILAGPLGDLAERFSYLVKTNGKITLSGILAEQGEGLREHYGQFFTMNESTQEGDWIRLDGHKDEASV